MSDLHYGVVSRSVTVEPLRRRPCGASPGNSRAAVCLLLFRLSFKVGLGGLRTMLGVTVRLRRAVHRFMSSVAKCFGGRGRILGFQNERGAWRVIIEVLVVLGKGNCLFGVGCATNGHGEFLFT